MKKILWVGAGLVAGICMFACGDSSSSTSFEIPTYRNEAALPDSCSMEVAKVDTAYFACFENKWVEVKDSAIVEQLKEGLDEEEVKAKLEELEELLKADTPATPAKPKSSSSEETDEDVESSDSEEPESSDSEEEECTGRHCKGDDSGSGSESGSGSGSGSGKSSSSTGGGTSTEVSGPAGLSFLNSGVTWTKAESQDCPITLDFPCKAAFHYEATITDRSITKKLVENGLRGFSAKDMIASAPAAQIRAVETVMQIEELLESDSLFTSSADDPMLEGDDYALYNIVLRDQNLYIYRQVLDMTGTATSSTSSSSEGEGSSASEGDDSSSSEVVESSASVEESSSSEVVESSTSVEESSSSVEDGEPCGDTTYDPETQYCLNGVVKNIKFTVSRSQIYVDGDSTKTSLSVEDALDCDISWTNVSSVRRMSSFNNNCAWIFSNNNSDKETKPVVVSLTSVDYGSGAVVPNGVTTNIKVFGTAWGRLSNYDFLDSYVKWNAYIETLDGRKVTIMSKAASTYPCSELTGFKSVASGLEGFTKNCSAANSTCIYTRSSLDGATYAVIFKEVDKSCEIGAGVERSSGRI